MQYHPPTQYSTTQQYPTASGADAQAHHVQAPQKVKSKKRYGGIGVVGVMIAALDAVVNGLGTDGRGGYLYRGVDNYLSLWEKNLEGAGGGGEGVGDAGE